MGNCTLRTPGFKPPGYLDCSETDTESEDADEQPVSYDKQPVHEPNKKGNTLYKQLLDRYNADILNHDLHYSKEGSRIEDTQDQQHDQDSSVKCMAIHTQSTLTSSGSMSIRMLPITIKIHVQA